jgi:methylated-DNA-[protein]-cysteine S-methyltransferase
MTLSITTWNSPVGALVVASHATAVCALEFADEWRRAERYLARRFGSPAVISDGDPAGAVPRLEAYFSGDLKALDDLAIDPRGTPFQMRVWRELRTIAPGQPISYRDLAERVGCASGFRAVGSANRLNPLAIVVPCHRVIGADGGMRGYAGGVDRKRWLLHHEQTFSLCPPLPFPLFLSPLSFSPFPSPLPFALCPLPFSGMIISAFRPRSLQ